MIGNAILPKETGAIVDPNSPTLMGGGGVGWPEGTPLTRKKGVWSWERRYNQAPVGYFVRGQVVIVLAAAVPKHQALPLLKVLKAGREGSCKAEERVPSVSFVAEDSFSATSESPSYDSDPPPQEFCHP